MEGLVIVGGPSSRKNETADLPILNLSQLSRARVLNKADGQDECTTQWGSTKNLTLITSTGERNPKDLLCGLTEDIRGRLRISPTQAFCATRIMSIVLALASASPSLSPWPTPRWKGLQLDMNGPEMTRAFYRLTKQQ